LIRLICDIKAMEEAVVEMKYDAKKAPLGQSLSLYTQPYIFVLCAMPLLISMNVYCN